VDGRVKPGHDAESQRSRHLVLKYHPALKTDQPDQVHHGRRIELDGEIDAAIE
jgi:hypothetical protein